ncbi:hypothetical protein C0Q70_14880 [Pomacea canaliculata]|uniref:Uncharacterized protein n=1 Tax=Pomacea canaliculata TaxID=400727 RepID=A0A2T7NT96_POMCA|nr:hypothetical protein C0Q70_14880 [Pomacea canaliculata]
MIEKKAADVQARDSRDNTLHLAVKRSFDLSDILSRKLKKAADVHARDSRDNTTLVQSSGRVVQDVLPRAAVQVVRPRAAARGPRRGLPSIKTMWQGRRFRDTAEKDLLEL